MYLFKPRCHQSNKPRLQRVLQQRQDLGGSELRQHRDALAMNTSILCQAGFLTSVQGPSPCPVWPSLSPRCSVGAKPVAAQQVDKQVQPCQLHWVLLFLLKSYLIRWLLLVLPVLVHLWTRQQLEKAVKPWSQGDHSWVNLEVGRDSCNFRG